MSTTQELIDGLRGMVGDQYTTLVMPDTASGTTVLEAAARLTEQAAELDALRGKLAGVDEAGIERAAAAIHARYEATTHWVKTLKNAPRPFEASGIKEVHRLDARAAIAAYLAAVRDKG